MFKDMAKQLKLVPSSPVYQTLEKFWLDDYDKLTQEAIGRLQFGDVDDRVHRGFVVLTSDLGAVDDKPSHWTVWLSVTETKEISPATKTNLNLNDLMTAIGIGPIQHLLFIRPFIDALNCYAKAGYSVEPEFSKVDPNSKDPLLFTLSAENKPRVTIRFDYHLLMTIEERFMKLQKSLQKDDSVIASIAGF